MIITLGFHCSSVYLSLVFDASSTIIYHRLKITYKTEQKLTPRSTSKPRPYRNLVLPRQFAMLITQKDFVLRWGSMSLKLTSNILCTLNLWSSCLQLPSAWLQAHATTTGLYSAGALCMPGKHSPSEVISQSKRECLNVTRPTTGVQENTRKQLSLLNGN